MANTNKMYITAAEIAEVMGVSVSQGYKIVKQLNNELQDKGYITVSGKVPKPYFEKRCYGFTEEMG